jgi:hypothetical protein
MEINYKNIQGQSFTFIFPRSGPLNLLCGAGKFEKIWSTCGQHEMQYIKWRMNKHTYN